VHNANGLTWSSGLETGFVLAGLVALAGCGAARPPAAPLAPAQDVFPPVAVADAVDFVQVEGFPAEKFALKRAVLTVDTTTANNPTELKRLLQRLSVQVLSLELGGPQLPLGDVLPPKDPKLPRRVLPPRPQTELWVSLPRLSAEDADRVIAQRFPGKKVTFATERGKQAFAFLLSHQQDGLAPDFVVNSAQTFRASQEGANVPGLNRDGYWSLTGLSQAWPLALGARVPAVRLPSVRVAVVDQGFKSEPDGMIYGWKVGDAWDRAGYDTANPWHGTDCASVINATANDKIGAAGSALLSAKSQTPTSPPASLVELVAAILPPGPVSLHGIANMIEQSVVSGNADIVSVSYEVHCSFACQVFGQHRRLERVLADMEAGHVAVVFAAGNQGLELRPDPSAIGYWIGCQRQGKAICVGATNLAGHRPGFSNFGTAVTTFAPGEYVTVNPLDGSTSLRYFSGTSASAPFVAGVLALAEASWGVRLGNRELRGLIADSSRLVPAANPKLAVPVLDAATLLLQRLEVQPDGTEPNELAPLPSAPALPLGPAIGIRSLSLGDVDVYPVDVDGKDAIAIDVHFTATPSWSGIELSVSEAATHREVVRTPSGTPGCVTLTTPATLAAGRYHLKVARAAALPGEREVPIIYDVAARLATEPGGCQP
jgi:subtilisin family serine protease